MHYKALCFKIGIHHTWKEILLTTDYNLYFIRFLLALFFNIPVEEIFLFPDIILILSMMCVNMSCHKILVTV